jgi:hypothetical protein
MVIAFYAGREHLGVIQRALLPTTSWLFAGRPHDDVLRRHCRPFRAMDGRLVDAPVSPGNRLIVARRSWHVVFA